MTADGRALAVVIDPEFARAEAAIERGLETFVEVGEALLAIKDHPEWYRTAGYTDFGDYVKRRWDMSWRHADRLMEAVRVTTAIGPIGPTPVNEAQARPLTALLPQGPATVAEAWQEAVETAPNGKVTAAHIEGVVMRRVRMRKIPAEPLSSPPADKSRVATRARHERIAEMASEGYREEAIAEAVGMSTGGVRGLMAARGIPTLSSKIGRLRTIDTNKVMDGIVDAVTLPDEAVGALDWRALDRRRFEEWDQRLTDAIRILFHLRKALRKA